MSSGSTGSRRVAITGFGVVAPAGIGTENYWSGLNGPGATGGQHIELTDWDPAPYFDNAKDARRADRVEQFALAASAEAFEQAGGVDAIGVEPGRFGTIFGTGIGGLHTLEAQVLTLHEKGERRVSPFLVPMMMANASGAAVSMRYNLQGQSETITTACAAGTHALNYAARLIKWGIIDAAASGGSESAGTATSLAGFRNMTALSSSGVSMPFAADRDGFVMGEGAAVFILEEWSIAEARGATILGEVMGGASNADAHHITAPAPGGRGAISCMHQALDEAGLQPGDIKQVNAHGTSTPLNDAAEADAITTVFGERAVPVVSTKGVTGHALGAAGALEAAAVLLSFEKRQIPPTANTTEADPEMSIDLVTGAARGWEPGPTISNNFGFGGHNGSIVIAPPA
ncbi:beta-ketoacyl-[acyl-carrier-protein] synthase family protein [Ilumatobacter coccineus]|uniref:3-oxoacyl-[acyl-carrier-protein] synthase II n=1 Tax=Ilumatobacter coccineus (strain NBRC 103263 / KCTC 29153 / YM16-304) TaxID=1313172 RepID=A0A6C7E379_ILUCY|nr:beta-ketoacyl-ACP synthase II [Ilumatobacter coccineus]BAN02444.1 3-oxoacyl-[acyl-carrier-protein] synthase II [Ilumatobacter coccineus YM16-304]